MNKSPFQATTQEKVARLQKLEAAIIEKTGWSPQSMEQLISAMLTVAWASCIPEVMDILALMKEPELEWYYSVYGYDIFEGADDDDVAPLESGNKPKVRTPEQVESHVHVRARWGRGVRRLLKRLSSKARRRAEKRLGDDAPKKRAHYRGWAD